MHLFDPLHPFPQIPLSRLQFRPMYYNQSNLDFFRQGKQGYRGRLHAFCFDRYTTF